MIGYLSLLLVIFVGLTLFYGLIAIHDIPYEIAKSRNHPHQDAIHVAGWVSLFTLHVIWPFLWIWATLYREDRGWGFGEVHILNNKIFEIERKLQEMESIKQTLEQQLASQQQHFNSELEKLREQLKNQSGRTKAKDN